MRQVSVGARMKFHVSKAGSDWMNELWATASSAKDITTFSLASYQLTWHTTAVAQLLVTDPHDPVTRNSHLSDYLQENTLNI
jgi:hypothetical protein